MTALLARPDTTLAATLEAQHRRRGSKWKTRHASALLLGGATPDDREIWSVKVSEKHRGKGYGGYLMQTLTAYADACSFRLTLCVHAHNEPAMRLYTSVGFVITHAGPINTMTYTPAI